MTQVNDSDAVEYPSSMDFEATIERLVTTIQTAGMTVFARIDHAAGARDVGMAMPPALVLIYGHAKGGTPMMLAAPLAALDLPLRVLVHEDASGQVRIALHPIVAVLQGAGVPEALAQRLAPAQRLLVDAIQ
jgi:uncharacterized protein (DUF302 family)